jgi:hypothetical protein
VAVARGKDALPLFPHSEIFLNTIPVDSRRLWIFEGLFCNLFEMYVIYFEFCIICTVDVKYIYIYIYIVKVNELFFFL